MGSDPIKEMLQDIKKILNLQIVVTYRDLYESYQYFGKRHLTDVANGDILAETGEEIQKLFGFVHCCSYLLMIFLFGRKRL